MRICRKPIVVLAALVMCLTLSVTALASSGRLQGFFRDITDFWGAVVGTSYEQATDEVAVDVAVNGGELTVLTTFLKPDAFPYREAERLGIGEYRILDAAGKILQKGSAEPSSVVNGQAAIVIHLKDMKTGSYTLTISSFVLEKKADQPLTIKGSWGCAFSK